MLSKQNRKRTLILALCVSLLTILGTFGFVRYIYAPVEGHYTYNAAPKLGGVAFPPFGFVLGTESQEQVAHIVKKYGMVGAGLTITDFEKNERPLVWWMVDKLKFPEFYNEYKTIQDSRKSRKERSYAIFTEDEKLNRVVSRLLDGQHVCEPIRNTLLYKMMPNSESTIDRICYAAIPPYGGAMSGYLTLFIPRGLSDEQLGEIRSAMIEVQLDIFNRDIRKIQVSNGLKGSTPALPAIKSSLEVPALTK